MGLNKILEPIKMFMSVTVKEIKFDDKNLDYFPKIYFICCVNLSII